MKYPALQARSSWAPCRLLYGSLVGSQELFQGDPSIGRVRLASAGVSALADFDGVNRVDLPNGNALRRAPLGRTRSASGVTGVQEKLPGKAE